jgi:spore coat polysaccharide biosynthesis predicted glycosyltransferase SpsG
MRALALAQAWLDRGGRVRWLLAEAPAALEARIAGEGIDVIPVVDARASIDDAATLQAQLADDAMAVAAVDGLAFGAAYLRALVPHGDRVLVVDDAAGREAYPVGFVLNQNAHADRGAYRADETPRFLLGTDYVLLRREFVADPPPPVIPERATHLLVTFGGADPAGVTKRVVRALAALPPELRTGAEVRVIAGAANPDAEGLATEARRLEGRLAIGVERGVTNMPALLTWADLAITAGGSTVWELARLGCPAIVIETVPVETMLAGGLARVGLGERLGHADTLEDATITESVARRMSDRAWRQHMSELGRRVVDGKGASRVVDALASEVMERA